MKFVISSVLSGICLFAQAAYAETPPPAKPAKVCSVYSDSGWRDSIREGDGAVAANCQAYMKMAKAEHYQIGCMAPDGLITLGAADGGAPAENCGW